MLCLPPNDHATKIEQKEKIIVNQASSPQDLARKHLVTIGLFSDIIFSILYAAPFVVGYHSPRVLLTRRWQNSFKEFLDFLDFTRQIVFSILYITIDLIGILYQKQHLFKEHVL